MRWGLIGASTIAREWMVDAVRANGGDIRAVMSTSTTRGQDFAKQCKIPKAVNSLDALFAESLDAVYISTTNELHHDQVIQSAAHGVNVLCEKPLSLTLASATQMVQACESAGLVMATNHHLRHAATHRAIRQQIVDGQLGTLHSARVFHAVYLPEHLQGWRITQPETGAGVVLDITVHNADTLAFLLGEYPLRVTSRTANHGMGKAGLEDTAMGIWEFPSGLMAFTHEGFTLPHAKTGLELHGSKASLYAENVMTQKAGGTVRMRNADGEREIKTDPENLYTRLVRNFVDSCRNKTRPDADGWAGVRSLAVALATLESARSGKTVTVDYGKAPS